MKERKKKRGKACQINETLDVRIRDVHPTTVISLGRFLNRSPPPPHPPTHPIYINVSCVRDSDGFFPLPWQNNAARGEKIAGTRAIQQPILEGGGGGGGEKK